MVCIFGLPMELLTHNGRQFIRKLFLTFYEELKIKLCHSTLYKPQENNQVKSSNKILINIMKKNLEEAKGE